jgi:hypothetical protein
MDRATLESALRKADAAGDTEGAKVLARAIRELDTGANDGYEAPPAVPKPKARDTPTPPGFPRVSSEEQRARDLQAVPLLEDERSAATDPKVQAALDADIQARQSGNRPFRVEKNLARQTMPLAIDPESIVSRIRAPQEAGPQMTAGDSNFIPTDPGKESMAARTLKGLLRAGIGSTVGMPGNAAALGNELFGVKDKKTFFPTTDELVRILQKHTGINLHSRPPEDKSQALADSVVEGAGAAAPWMRANKVKDAFMLGGSAAAGAASELASSFGEGFRGPANILTQLLTQGKYLKTPNDTKLLKPVLKGISEDELAQASSAANKASATTGLKTSIAQGFESHKPNQLVGGWDELVRSVVGGPAQRMLADQTDLSKSLAERLIGDLPNPAFKKPRAPRKVETEVESGLVDASGKPIMKTVKVAPPKEKAAGPEEFEGVLREGPAAIRAAAAELRKTDTSGGSFMQIVRDSWRKRFDARLNQGGKHEDWAVDIAGRPGTTERESFRAIMDEALKIRGLKDPKEIEKAIRIAEETADAMLVMARGRRSMGTIDPVEFSRGAGENTPSNILRIPGFVTGGSSMANKLERMHKAKVYEKMLDHLMSPRAFDYLMQIKNYSSTRNAANEFGRYLAQAAGQVEANEKHQVAEPHSKKPSMATEFFGINP